MTSDPSAEPCPTATRSAAAGSTLSTDDIAVVTRVVRSRRTNLRIDPVREVDDSTLIDLCGLACWAPNHKLTEPWRFAAVSGDSRATLGRLTAAFQQANGESDEARLDKTRKKYLRSPVVLLVASAFGDDPGRRAEDRDAVACGVQNILLGATALGLNSYWGTGAITAAPAVKELAGFGPDDTIVAAIYLGWPLGPVPVPERRTPVIRWLG